MPDVPTGTVTFLFTDIEGSTRLWEQNSTVMRDALARHDTLLRQTIENHGGYVFKTVGDAFCAAFATAPDALAAALEAQRAFYKQAGDRPDSPISNLQSPVAISLRVRMAIHTGAAEERDGDYFGPPVNRVARLLSAGHGGQVILSLAARALVYETLPEGVTLRDLGEHRLKDLGVPEHIYQLVAADLPADFPSLKTLDARPNNLPASISRLIGREREVATVRGLLLRPDVRLVTLSGPGGTGKTRLALQVAAELLDATIEEADTARQPAAAASAGDVPGHPYFADGVFFVGLAAVTDPALVPSAIARAVNVKETGGQGVLDTLKASLRARRLLLVLDNFEQIMAAAPVVADLLAAAPGLKTLVTSREVLHLSGEYHYSVPPLAVPDLTQPPFLDHVTHYEAVQLFIERARAARADFAISNENAATVAEICRRVDGLPLAIELAAARVRLLSPQAILTRLSSRLKLLSAGARDLPTRQQTLRNTIAWSYDLLNGDEKTLFGRLSVFVGGFTLKAAEAVCQVEGSEGVQPATFHLQPLTIDVLDAVGSLVDKSLLRTLPSPVTQEEGAEEGEPRFGMLETIREYALEQTAAEQEILQRRHAQFFLSLAQQAEPQLMGLHPLPWQVRIEQEHDNLRAAFGWALEHGTGQMALELAVAVWWFRYLRGYLSEGRTSLERALAKLDGSPDPALHARAFHALGVFAYAQGDYQAARTSYEQALAVRRTLDNRGATARTLNNLGLLAYDQGEYERAAAFYTEGLTIAREIGDRAHEALQASNLGLVARARGDLATARSMFQEALAVRQELDDQVGMSHSLENLAIVALDEGDYGTARRLTEEALALRRALGHTQMIAYSLDKLGVIALQQGEHDRARELIEESLQMTRELGDKLGMGYALQHLAQLALAQGESDRARSLHGESLVLQQALGQREGIQANLAGLARLAVRQQQPGRAVRLFAAAQACLDHMGAALPARRRAWREEELAAARAQLAAAFDAAWQEGQAMTLEQAVAYALEAGDVDRAAAVTGVS